MGGLVEIHDRVRCVEPKRPVRICGAESAGASGEAFRGKGDRRRQRGDLAVVDVSRRFDRALETVEPVAQRRKQRLSAFRQSHAARLPFEQLHAEPVFELADLMADGGRRDIQFFRRRFEPGAPRRGLERAQRAQWREFAHGLKAFIRKVRIDHLLRPGAGPILRSLMTSRTRRSLLKIEQVHIHPDPYAPFLLSQAIRVGDFVFVSGQPAIGDDGRIDGPGDFERQAERAFGNLARVLEAAGSGMDRVVKTTVFLSSMSYLDKMVDVRRKWFSAPYPAESLVEVAALFSPDALIEVEAIAVVSDSKVDR